jgi:hypothetical protein
MVMQKTLTTCQHWLTNEKGKRKKRCSGLLIMRCKVCVSPGPHQEIATTKLIVHLPTREFGMRMEWLTCNKPVRHWATLAVMFVFFVLLVLS